MTSLHNMQICNTVFVNSTNDFFLQDNPCYVGEMKQVNTERIPMSCDIIYCFTFWNSFKCL